jgi:23S rRNA pseudoU1915 N3-methylase RlmH
MRARLIAVGERMPGWVAEGFAEYRKRLSHELPLELIELKPGMRGKGRDDGRAIRTKASRSSLRCRAISMSWRSMVAARAGPARSWPNNWRSGEWLGAIWPS